MIRMVVINDDNEEDNDYKQCNGKKYFHKLNCRLINLLHSNNNSNEKVIEMEKNEEERKKTKQEHEKREHET